MRLSNILQRLLISILALVVCFPLMHVPVNSAEKSVKDIEKIIRDRFLRIDTNGDDSMSPKEYTAYRIATFNSMDLDASGSLALKEFRDRGKKPSNRRAKRRTKTFQRIDKNKDSIVSQDEWDGYANRRFIRMDTDKDRKVSFLEFIAYIK